MICAKSGTCFLINTGRFVVGSVFLLSSSRGIDVSAQDSMEVKSSPAVVVQFTDAATPVQPPTTLPADGSTPAVAGQPAAAATPGTPVVDASGATNSVKRPTADKFVPQAIDLEIRKNPDGEVSFNIVGQPWEAVLQWLSDASALSLDWQELPGDSLNLITTRNYTMEQARDLINRHLLTRGFTMIVSGEVMSIVKVKELNPAIVPRVTPDMLAGLPDHTICKVSFDLDWLIADEAVDELKPMLSSAGQMHKLSRTNRLEVIDTAISLRHIWELLENEQSDTGEERLVRAFRLQHRRAEDVIRLLRELLKLQDSGAPAAAGGGGMDPNMVMQMMQQMQQAMQQAAAAAQPGAGGGPKKEIETRLVLNQRENMILAQAAPDQMAIIEKAVEQIDVPGDAGKSLLQNLNRMKIYRLETVDPQTLTDLLQQLGDMDPGTVLKVDKNKRSIIAWATLADHLTISTLVEKLDQSSRQFEVIPLRRLDAEYVAGTIRVLMDKEEKQEDNSSRQRFYGFFDYGGGGGAQETAKEPSFKIEADIEHNRLLVNANSLEMDEIRTLLIKLGELPDPNSSDNGMRVFEINADEDLQELQQRLQQYWRRGNELEFDLPDPLPEAPDATDEGEKKSLKKSGSDADVTNIGEPSARRVNVWKFPDTRAQQSSSSAFDQLLESRRQNRVAVVSESAAVLTTLTDDPPAEIAEEPPASDDKRQGAIPPATVSISGDPPMSGSGDAVLPSAEVPGDDVPPEASPPVIDQELIERLRKQLGQDVPEASDVSETVTSPEEFPRTRDGSSPVKISVTPDGKLIASSRDAEALAEFEQLMGQVAAPRRSYKLFRLKYATPSWVTLNLKDFFKSEEQTKSGFEYDPYYGIMPSQKKTKGNHSLSKRRQPQFISDNFTSTILVRDADTKQLETIEDLIGIYDVPEPSDTRSMRVTTIFRLDHARASSVAAAVKDVFRDLLSSNDKALEADDKGQRAASSGLVTFLPRGPSSGDSSEDEEEPIRFKGLLSIGIDDSSNTLIVSSAGSLMDTIGEMIESLDKAADSASVVQVVKVDKSVDLALIQERLRSLMQPTAPPNGLQPGQQPGQPGQPQPGQPGAPGTPQGAAEAAVQVSQ